MKPSEAKALAVKAHANQTRRDGSPYHTHPITVAAMLTEPSEQVVAYLHDVIEDCPGWNLISDLETVYQISDPEQTEYNLSKEEYYALTAITQNPDEPVSDYIKRVSTDPIAIKVKIADMFHNTSDNPTTKNKQKYMTNLKYLLTKL